MRKKTLNLSIHKTNNQHHTMTPNSPTKTKKNLDAAKATVAKLETAIDRQRDHLVDLEAETAGLAKDHRSAATAAAIEGDPAPPAPMRLAQAQAELTTGRAVLSDLETRLTDARAEVVKAEAQDVTARRRAVVGPLEKQGQKLWLEIAEKFTELVDLTGMAGWDATHSLTWTSGNLHPEHDPILKALKADGLDFGEGAEIDVIPAGKFAQDFTDGILLRHNGEPHKQLGPRI